MTLSSETQYTTLSNPPTGGIWRWGRRISTTTWLVIGAAILALIANLVVFRTIDNRVGVLVAAHDLPIGHQLSPADWSITPVGVDPEVMSALVAETAAEEMVGQIVVRSVGEGELLRTSDVLGPAAPAGKMGMSIPIEIARAVGGDLSPGDRIDVIDTEEVNGIELSHFVATNLLVLSVPGGGGGGLTGGGDFFVTVAVNRIQALSLAEAISNGELSVLVSTGAKLRKHP